MCSGCAGDYSGDYENWDPDPPVDAADSGGVTGAPVYGTHGFAGPMGSDNAGIRTASDAFRELNPRWRRGSGSESRQSRSDSALVWPRQEPHEEPLRGDDFEVMVSADRIVEIRVMRDKSLPNCALRGDTSLCGVPFERVPDKRSNGESAKHYQTQSGSEEYVQAFRRAWVISCISVGIAAAMIAGAMAAFFLRG